MFLESVRIYISVLASMLTINHMFNMSILNTKLLDNIVKLKYMFTTANVSVEFTKRGSPYYGLQCVLWPHILNMTPTSVSNIQEYKKQDLASVKAMLQRT